MVESTKLIDEYQQIINRSSLELQKIKRQIHRTGTLRIILFLVAIGAAWHLYSAGAAASVVVGTFLLALIPFLVLVKWHTRLFEKRAYMEKKIEINQQEIAALGYDFSSFDGGTEYIDSSHVYTYDLDIFGHHSLFQCVNRTSTFFGKQQLAKWFAGHLTEKTAIENRQEAIRVLAPNIEFRQEFRIKGLLYKGNLNDGDEISQWLASPNIFKGKRIYEALICIVPSVNAILLLLGVSAIIDLTWFGLSFMLFVISNFLLQKRISTLQNDYEKRLKILSTYSGLMKATESYTKESPSLLHIHRKLVKGNKPASEAIRQLASKLKALDQRNNILVSTALNGLLFWELRQVMRIETWKESYAENLVLWLEALGEMDALCSLSTFAYNNPDYTFAQIAAQPFVLEATEMAHPLMERSKCVKNRVTIPKQPFFAVVTGANMAGKSTYLRTIGVNYLLACMGVPVACNRMKLYPSSLITSLRTTDSLSDNESYFYAELKRLKLIIDKLKEGKKLFIILDEILKGTNSVDKQKGSLALLKQFMSLEATGIIATHDLLLGSLSDSYPGDIRNYRFEADITNNELSFSYTLQEGIAQNMNACFLMEKMGIIVEE